jgi:uncharacterized protein (DUF58 family)
LFASITWQLDVLDRITLSLVVVLAIAWLWNRFSLSGIGFERTLMLDRVNVGDLVVEEITISNRSWIPKLWVEMDDASTLPNHKTGRVVTLGSRKTRTWRVETVAVRRGKYRLGPSHLSAADPLGLFASEKVLPVHHSLIVFPAKVDISSIPMPTATLSGGRAAPQLAMVNSAMFNSIREYAPGDPMNRIAWRATAHRGQLMVKEFDPDPSADLWILLDLNDDGQFDLHYRSDIPSVYQHLNTTVEYVVSIGASLATAALAQGRKVGLILNRQDPIRIEPDNSERQWFRIAETLAVVTSRGSRSITESLTADHRRFSRTSALVVITADPRSDWVAAGAALVERLVPVTAVVVDAGGEGQDDIDPLLRRLASARIHIHRYPTHRSPADSSAVVK